MRKNTGSLISPFREESWALRFSHTEIYLHFEQRSSCSNTAFGLLLCLLWLRIFLSNFQCPYANFSRYVCEKAARRFYFICMYCRELVNISLPCRFPSSFCHVLWVGFFLVDRCLLTLQWFGWRWQKCCKMLAPLTDSYIWIRQFPNSIFDVLCGCSLGNFQVVVWSSEILAIGNKGSCFQAAFSVSCSTPCSINHICFLPALMILASSSRNVCSGCRSKLVAVPQGTCCRCTHGEATLQEKIWVPQLSVCSISCASGAFLAAVPGLCFFYPPIRSAAASC